MTLNVRAASGAGRSVARGARPARGAQHILALDGLRGIAALAIILYHRRWWAASDRDFLQHAYLAVDFFFLLSGLVIARAYEAGLHSGAMRWTDFALLRVVRLYPLLVIGALLGALFLCLRGVADQDYGLVGRALGGLPFAGLLLPLPPMLFELPFAMNEPSWTLFFELVANLAFALAAPRLSNRTLAITIAIFAGLLILVAVQFDGLNTGWRWETLHGGAARVGFSFLLGVGLHRAARCGRLPRLQAGSWLPAVLLVAVFCPSLFPRTMNASYDIAAAMLLFPAIIVLGCNCRPTTRVAPLLRGAGLLSYPAYIIHVPLLALYEAMIWRLGLPNLVMLGLGTAATGVAAWLLARYYDAPVRKVLGMRLVRRRTTRSPQG
ncbi:acyltransferase family protein [Sphingomonas sp. S2-65]|uniref:acyltransferase family protein n=1 Tax=Sphingomonas sp. S2-65 TaxID=2903960 RepID=UPI001F2B3BDD|nr:acyltransferase [Sphingomonas sp. S2-65]UYY57060.1 acyltransferase [Sphingomonas sp. S2-65]